jgi:hypothetical protein
MRESFALSGKVAMATDAVSERALVPLPMSVEKRSAAGQASVFWASLPIG